MSRKIQKLAYQGIQLPSVWQNIDYFSAVYYKNISEIKGYFEVGWSELKTLAPELEIKWPNKFVYFKLKINKPENNILTSQIVGFDEINKNSNKLLRKKYARQIVDLKLEDVTLQLQLLYAKLDNISQNTITKLRNDVTKLIQNLEIKSSAQFFEEYIDGIQQKIGKKIKEIDVAYNSVGLFRIVKCKIK